MDLPGRGLQDWEETAPLPPVHSGGGGPASQGLILSPSTWQYLGASHIRPSQGPFAGSGPDRLCRTGGEEALPLGEAALKQPGSKFTGAGG